jgi:hypothetical protein
VTAASSKELLRAGVVTSSQIEQNWPITANAEAWDFNDLTCSSITKIRLIALNVTTPSGVYRGTFARVVGPGRDQVDPDLSRLTVEKGYNERFNGTLRSEVLNTEWFSTTDQAQIVINQWLRQYNHVRPHQALCMRSPVPEAIYRNV